MNPTQARQLRGGVWRAYSAVADNPRAKHPFPVGRRLAVNVGYPRALLATLPTTAINAFAGVSYVPGFAAMPAGSIVLDLGCGAGLDTLCAATQVGPTGQVFSIDFSPTMLNRTEQAIKASGLGNVRLVRSDAEMLPLPTASIDVALVNGIFNLNPARDAIFAELARVVRPGGAVYAAELVLRAPLSQVAAVNEATWFA